jgi:anti-sigma regulatory factor (Ser/Thr protein kinase)
MSEHAEIDLPLSARYATTVRAVAASMAATISMSIDDIDDLRLGVNEAISVLTDLDDDAPTTGRLHVRFEVESDRIRVVASRSGVEDRPGVELDVLAERILGAVVDEYSVDDTGAFLLVKQVSADGDS